MLLGGQEADSDAVPDDEEMGQPTLMPNLTRLLVSHYLREHPHRVVLIKLYRPFVFELVDKARQAGLGSHDVPSFYDADAMTEIVEKFELQRYLLETWTGVLLQPDKLIIDRIIGADERDRLSYGVEISSQVIELGIAFALNVKVDGWSEIYNEVKEEYVRAPLYDHTTPGFLVRYLDIYLPQVDRVLVDEAHDANANDCHAAYKMVKPGGALLMMRDESQALNQWASADLDAQNRLMAGATEHQSPRNYRSALSICELAQTVLDEQGRDITIIQVRDVVGAVEFSDLHATPFDLSTTNLVLSRLVAHLPVMYSVLLNKKIPCVIIGHENTGRRLLALLAGVSQERGGTTRVLLSRSKELLFTVVTGVLGVRVRR